MKYKAWNIVAVVFIFGLGGMLINDMLTPDELDLRIEKRRATENALNDTTASTVNMRLSAQQPPSVLPPRVLNAPTYDRLLTAARIENEAVDQSAAVLFLQLTTNRRNARLAAEVAKFTAQTKKYEADYEDALARIKASREGIMVGDSMEMIQNRTNMAVEALAEGKVEKKDNTISLRTYDDKTNEMMIKVGERWFTYVRSGQTISGYLVGAVDSALQCVPLTKDEEVQVICLN